MWWGGLRDAGRPGSSRGGENLADQAETAAVERGRAVSALADADALIVRNRTQVNEALKLLGQWHLAAISLGKPASYVKRIREVTADYQRGLPLSEKTIEARQQDLAAHQRQQQKPERNQDWGLSL